MSLPRIGLRGQLVLALSLVFVVAQPLLVMAALQLSRRNAQLAQRTQAQAWAAWLARSGPAAARPELLHRLRQLQQHGVIAAATVNAAGETTAIGTGPRGTEASAAENGLRLTLWLPPRRGAGTAGRLLALYAALAGFCALWLAYVLLTRTLVRPLQAAVVAAERLAGGDLEAHVPLRGAAEVIRLAQAFNRMTVALKQDRAALHTRVQELERTAGDLRAAQQQLVHGEKLASVGRLAAGVAHEIGNPLAAILGLLDLLRSGGLPAKTQREFVERIHRETERIHRIIGGLLDYARNEPDQDQDQLHGHADLALVVRDAVALVEAQREAQRVAFDVHIAPEARNVRGGGPQLTQIVLNLLLNALDALRGHGTVWVRSVRLDACVELTVEDNGPGLPAKVAERLFEPFVTSKAPGHGTGLGLAVCHTLCERLGGSISGENRPEGGARFRVRLLQPPPPR